MFRATLWIRAIIASLLATALLAYCVETLIPDLEFNWIGALVKCFGFAVLGIGIAFLVSCLIPPIICVQSKGIFRQEGQSVCWRLRSEIRKITVDVPNPVQPVLRVDANTIPFEAGISEKLNPRVLMEYLKQTFPELLINEKR